MPRDRRFVAHHSFRFQATRKGPRGSPDVRSRTCSSVELRNLRPILIDFYTKLQGIDDDFLFDAPTAKTSVQLAFTG